MKAIIHIKKHQRVYLILLLWIIVSFFNFGKAFHIDDTFHIEAAQHILDNPASPMSGEVNWGGSTKLISEFNQPPLFFYLIATVIYFFGSNEIALHLLVSLFSLMAIYYFDRILYYFKSKNASFYLTVFAICPAFIVNQNVMTDIPLLALILGSIYYFLTKEQNNKHLLFSFILISIAMLIKYSALPFLAAMLTILTIRKEYSSLKYFIIPIILLSIWSGWNFIEFGHIHLLGRPRNTINLMRIPEFLCCIGAILFISPFQKQSSKTTYYSIVIVSIIIGWFISQHDNSYTTNYLQAFFLLNGFLLIAFSIAKGLSKRSSNIQFLCITTCFIAGFIVLFAPFIATRHILLVVPFTLLILHSLDLELSKLNQAFGIGIALTLSTMISEADYKYADFYKDQAQVISQTDGNKYTIGYWGWQWYARQNGIKIYDKQSDYLEVNDLLIVPKDIAKQGIAKNIELTLIQTIAPDNNSINPIAVSIHGSLYNSFINRPVWTFSSQPLDTLCVYKVTGV